MLRIKETFVDAMNVNVLNNSDIVYDEEAFTSIPYVNVDVVVEDDNVVLMDLGNNNCGDENVPLVTATKVRFQEGADWETEPICTDDANRGEVRVVSQSEPQLLQVDFIS